MANSLCVLWSKPLSEMLAFVLLCPPAVMDTLLLPKHTRHSPSVAPFLKSLACLAFILSRVWESPAFLIFPFSYSAIFYRLSHYLAYCVSSLNIPSTVVQWKFHDRRDIWMSVYCSIFREYVAHMLNECSLIWTHTLEAWFNPEKYDYSFFKWRIDILSIWRRLGGRHKFKV